MNSIGYVKSPIIAFVLCLLFSSVTFAAKIENVSFVGKLIADDTCANSEDVGNGFTVAVVKPKTNDRLCILNRRNREYISSLVGQTVSLTGYTAFPNDKVNYKQGLRMDSIMLRTVNGNDVR